MKRILLLAAAFLVSLTTIGDAGVTAIRARVRIVKAMEPGELEVYVTVPPATANRAFEVVGYCEGEEVQRSFRQLEGDASEGPFQPVVWRELPGCEYAIAAVLEGQGGAPLGYATLRARINCQRCEQEDDSASRFPDGSRSDAPTRDSAPILFVPAAIPVGAFKAETRVRIPVGTPPTFRAIRLIP